MNLMCGLILLFFLGGCAFSINTNIGWNNLVEREMHDLVQDYETDVRTGDVKSKKRSVR